MVYILFFFIIIIIAVTAVRFGFTFNMNYIACVCTAGREDLNETNYARQVCVIDWDDLTALEYRALYIYNIPTCILYYYYVFNERISHTIVGVKLLYILILNICIIFYYYYARIGTYYCASCYSRGILFTFPTFLDKRTGVFCD